MGWNSTLTRKTPLRSKKPWRRKAKAKDNRGKFTDKRRTPLKKVSSSQRRKLREYYPERDAFLAANPWCVICAARSLPINAATEVHHIRGRAGKLISDTRFFAASCRSCREWPHDNPRQARELGLLAQPGEWGVRPPEKESSI